MARVERGISHESLLEKLRQLGMRSEAGEDS
jgi:hypothetical protein